MTQDQPATPTATYRLQLHAGFTFADAEQVVPYLADLGISHLYLSPILTAVPGSMHGYDLLDHNEVNPELGGREGFEALVEECRQHHLGVVVDIVPNHMALSAPQWRNRQVWELLLAGRTASTAHWFDIDWRDGRVGLPILGESVDQAVASGDLRVDVGRDDEGPAAGQPVLRYHDHVLPIGAATDGADVTEILKHQHYRLAHWRDGAEVLNYRRFFEVDTLIAVRVEQPDVFERTHRELIDLHHHGLIDGFRIDHPDGLADPTGYLRMLAGHLRPGTPVWVEKILHRAGRDEWLPPDWACAGTTGYDATAVLLEAFTDPLTSEVVDECWESVGGRLDFSQVEQQAKAEVVDTLLGAELNRLTTLAASVLPSQQPDQLAAALRVLLVSADAYRVYLYPGRPSERADLQRLQGTIDRATERVGDLGRDQTRELTGCVQAIGRVLLEPDSATHDRASARDLAVRFHQVTGPVLAKGIEDTAFYRWHRLVARNEVGADPAAPAGHDALHAWASHQQQHWPAGMTTLSTHDTKRSEDVRAAIVALAGHADHWRSLTTTFADACETRGVDAATGQLVWQTLVGVGPIAPDRLHEYLIKAVREAKTHTSWVQVDADYERAVLALADATLPGSGQGDPELIGALTAAIDDSRHDAEQLMLAQKAVQLTLPGVPDIYQGCELSDFSLVDPDNRRPVDYSDRVERLRRWQAGQAPADIDDRKLALTASLVQLRRARPDLFAGAYSPLDLGPLVLGYRRADDLIVLAVTAPAAMRTRGLEVPFELEERPGQTWRDVLTGQQFPGGTTGAELLAEVGVRVLVATAQQVGGDDG